MKSVTHRQLGAYLAERSGMSPRCTRVFLLGCVEPDKNFTTYFKGSLRNRWLRGHNWESADRYIRRVCRRLEGKRTLRLHDYYQLGKLIHYTADAFTHTHNGVFREGLAAHRQYENRLRAAFDAYLSESRDPRPVDGSASEVIWRYHRSYLSNWRGVQTDAAYAVAVCRVVLGKLLSPAPQPV